MCTLLGLPVSDRKTLPSNDAKQIATLRLIETTDHGLTENSNNRKCHALQIFLLRSMHGGILYALNPRGTRES